MSASLWGNRGIVADFAVMSKNSDAPDNSVTPLTSELAAQDLEHVDPDGSLSNKETVGDEPAESPAKKHLRALGAGKALALLLPVAVFVFAADQLTKVWAESALVLGDAPIPFIGTLVQLRLIYNPGAALSLASGQTWILTVVSVAVVVFIALMAKKLVSRAWVLTFGLVLGGALGNLYDRLFRAPGFPEGHVVDFLDYGPFIGNVADIAIVGAAILVGTLALANIPMFEGDVEVKQ